MRFAQSIFLILLLIIPILIQQFRKQHTRKSGSLRFSHVSRVRHAASLGFAKYSSAFSVIRLITIILLILALARPQSNTGDESISAEGIDIILTLDVSGSMQAEDFRPNRLEAAKQVAANFIRGRSNDRIGLVIFAGHSATQVPLTLDYDVVLTLLDQVHIGMLQEDGTAIGMAIANSVNRLRSSEATSKVIILLTDGANNRGEIDPLTAANLAHALQVKVYAIGVGSEYMTVKDPFFGTRQVKTDLDEDTLQHVAELTEAQYYRATDEESLARIYEEIEQLEKSQIDMQQYKDYVELFPYLAYAALGLLCIDVFLTHTRFRKIP